MQLSQPAIAQRLSITRDLLVVSDIQNIAFNFGAVLNCIIYFFKSSLLKVWLITLAIKFKTHRNQAPISFPCLGTLIPFLLLSSRHDFIIPAKGNMGRVCTFAPSACLWLRDYFNALANTLLKQKKN